MSDIGLTSKMYVKDVMTSPVITMDELVTSNKIANIMAEREVWVKNNPEIVDFINRAI